ncbi:S53 family peptidase [Allokutzneria multivorans]|uniref:S53 family peptidase n=1 Tax=Allokutzneria multivorans TaxID=1142134 RepID=A0ABP7SD38_9PSEU
MRISTTARRLAVLITATATVTATANLAGAATAQTVGAGERVEIAGSPPLAASTPRTAASPLPTERQIGIEIVLPLRDRAGAERLAHQVATHAHAPLSPKEFATRFGPTEDTRHAVADWVRSTGLTVQPSPEGSQSMSITGTVKNLNTAFATTLHATSRAADAARAPSTPPSIPKALQGKVTAVLGLSTTDTVQPQHVRGATSAQPGTVAPLMPGPTVPPAPGDQPGTGCARWWGEQNAPVPQRYRNQSNQNCGNSAAAMRAMHQLHPEHTGAGATVGFVVAYSNPRILTDHNAWAATMGLPPMKPHQLNPTPFPTENVGGCNQADWAGEEALDLAAQRSMAPEATFRTFGASSCATAHMYAALQAAITYNATQILSLSWGAIGETVNPALHELISSLGVQAAIQGITLIAASGDDGDNSARTPDGKPALMLPAANPWITAAGGTSTGLDRAHKPVIETGWAHTRYTLSGTTWTKENNRFEHGDGGGGGTSAVYPAPDWQRGIVPEQIAQGQRAIPDISSLGDPYTGLWVSWRYHSTSFAGAMGGTSLAAPLLAGMIANANQAQGRRVGFLNPSLYQLRGVAAPRDVVYADAGIWTPTDTPGGRLRGLDERPQTLQTRRGWDNLTGLGVPSGSGFLDRIGR